MVADAEMDPIDELQGLVAGFQIELDVEEADVESEMLAMLASTPTVDFRVAAQGRAG